MDQLNLFDDCPVEPVYKRTGPELRTLFNHIKINGHSILFSVIDFREKDPYIAYICWEDSERYHGNLSDEEIHLVEHEAYNEIQKILNISYEELEKRSSKERKVS